MTNGIELIVGLGNPGQQYQDTRHNAGALFLEALCREFRTELRLDGKLFGAVARTSIADQDLRLIFPTTYMNNSGQAVAAITQYFKIDPDKVLVAYDELDLPLGTTRLKTGGGHGGHNGIRDIIKALGTPNFHRMRIGIGHPGEASKVLNYVLGEFNRSEREVLDVEFDRIIKVLPLIAQGKMQIAMNKLHTRPEQKADRKQSTKKSDKPES